MAFESNREIAPEVEAVAAATSAEWVLNEQRVTWDLSLWRREWLKDPQLPHVETLDQLAAEFAEHKRIRRRFVSGFAEKNTPLLIAAMAWGYGTSKRGPARARKALTQGAESADVVIGEARTRLFSDGVAAGFGAMFRRNRPRIPWCNTAFATKVLHFMAYESDPQPRPLIYDQNVAWALARMPIAPPLPDPQRLTPKQYQCYCQWAQDSGHPPIVMEYALFEVGRRLFP